MAKTPETTSLELTRDEAAEILNSRLGMQNWETELAENPAEFLKTFHIAFVSNITYDNIFWAARPRSERVMPTIPEVISRGKTAPSGTCIHNNYFAYLILRALGLDVWTVIAESPFWPVNRSHIIVILRIPPKQKTDGEKEELYMLDVGFGGRPVLEPIPLHALPFSGPAGGGFTYEFRYLANNNKVIERMLYGGCPLFGPLKESEGGERQDFIFEPFKPITFEDFAQIAMKRLFEDQSARPDVFLNKPLICRMKSIKSRDEFDFVAAHGMVISEGNGSEWKDTKFETFAAMFPVLRDHLPAIDEQELRDALKNWDEEEEEWNAQKAAEEK